MHIRPYVDLPEPADEGTRIPDLEPFARCGRGETAELPVIPAHEDEEPGGSGDFAGGGAFAGSAAPAAYGHGAHGGDDGYDGYEADDARPEARPVPRGGSHRRRRGAAPYGRDDGTAKRRRPAKAAFAAAGVVAALGAGLFASQSLTGDGGGDDRSLSTDDTALPEIPDGGPSEDPSRTDERERDKKPSAKPTSRTDATDRRAARDGDEHTGRAPAPPRASGAPAPGGSGGSGGSDGRDHDHDWGWGGGNQDPERPRPPQDPSEPDDETLSAGDRGPEVVDLQRRLKQVGALDRDAAEDGVYSAEVQQAVAQYQARNGIRGDRYGEYGENTRRALENQTSG